MRTPWIVLVAGMAALSGCGGSSPQSESAKATAERASAAKHYGNSKYAEVKPLGAPETKKKDAPKPEASPESTPK